MKEVNLKYTQEGKLVVTFPEDKCLEKLLEFIQKLGYKVNWK